VVSRRAQAGLVLIPVLVSLVIIAAVVHLLDLQQGMRANSHARLLGKAVATDIAEAGVRDALWQARNSGGKYPKQVTGALSGHGSYKATIQTDPNNAAKITISSEGTTAGGIGTKLQRTYTLSCTNGTTTSTIRTYAAAGNPHNIIENSANNAQSGFLHPRDNTDTRTRSLITFDYSADVPAGATIEHAALLLDVQQHDPAMEGAHLYVNRLLQAWSDKEADWKHAQKKKAWQSPDKTGGYFTSVGEGSTTIAASIPVYQIDITEIMRAWVGGTHNYGLIIRTDGITNIGSGEFRLKSNTGSDNTYWPRLAVKWC
jgi:Tfp pilus assembly protein PilX